MAVTAYAYSNFAKFVNNGDIDFDTDTIKVMLTTSSYTPNQDTHDYVDDITNEVSGTGYTAGGATLASKTNTISTNVNTLDAADVTWSSSTITARYGVIYKDTGTPSTSPLIAYIDFGEDMSSSSSDFTISWNASGILTFTAGDA